jgi:hypothetical protein
VDREIESMPMGSGVGATRGGGDITLAGVLNILWRQRRILVLLPLLAVVTGVVYIILAPRMYEAKASIRPGITAYTPEGGPVRQWRLKDITRWYQDMLYRKQLIAELDLDPAARPIIRAEFIAQGLQNLQGGDVISLTTFAEDPDLARNILATSVKLFASYAEADTLSSGIELTRGGLEIRIERMHAEEMSLDREAKNIELRMAAAMAESLQIESEFGRIGLQIRDNEVLRERSRQNLGALKRQQVALHDNLAELDTAIVRLKGGALPEAESGDRALPSWIDPKAVLSGPDVLSSLVDLRARLELEVLENAVLADSLVADVERKAIAIEGLELTRDRDIVVQRLTAHQVIGELRLERSFGLQIQRDDIASRIRETEVQLNMISPVERVGRITVSDEPVRPRKLRVMLILTLLGLLGGLVTALAWDYVSGHRDEIFRS